MITFFFVPTSLEEKQKYIVNGTLLSSAQNCSGWNQKVFLTRVIVKLYFGLINSYNY